MQLVRTSTDYILRIPEEAPGVVDGVRPKEQRQALLSALNGITGVEVFDESVQNELWLSIAIDCDHNDTHKAIYNAAGQVTGHPIAVWRWNQDDQLMGATCA